MATEVPLGADTGRELTLADWVGKGDVMSGHRIEVCEFGVTHAQCQCPSQDKTRVQVVCDRPAEHVPGTEPQDQAPVERIRRFLDAWSGESGSYFVARAPGPDGQVVLRLTDLEAVVQTLELLRRAGGVR